MALVTLRLNEDEEKILAMLVKHLDEDKSKILKDALWEKFEDLRDRELIEEFEAKEAAGKVRFSSAEALINRISEKAPAYGPRIERPARKGPGRPRRKPKNP
jgi:predicted transcriptional regulator